MTLKEQKYNLEKRYVMMNEVHAKKFAIGIANEGAYIASAQNLMAMYEELHDLCEQLHKPIPRWVR